MAILRRMMSVAIFLALGPPGHADLVTINFDPPYQNTTALGVENLSWEFYGGTYASGDFRIVASPLAVSPPNIAMPLDLDGKFFTNLGAYFILPGMSSISTAPTDFVSFWVVPTGPYDNWQVVFYAGGYGTAARADPDNVLATIPGQSGGNTLVSFYRPEGDIGSFALISSSGLDGMDDLSFDAPVVPEPRTVLLLAIAMAMLLTARISSGYHSIF